MMNREERSERSQPVSFDAARTAISGRLSVCLGSFSSLLFLQAAAAGKRLELFASGTPGKACHLLALPKHALFFAGPSFGRL